MKHLSLCSIILFVFLLTSCSNDQTAIEDSRSENLEEYSNLIDETDCPELCYRPFKICFDSDCGPENPSNANLSYSCKEDFAYEYFELENSIPGEENCFRVLLPLYHPINVCQEDAMEDDEPIVTDCWISVSITAICRYDWPNDVIPSQNFRIGQGFLFGHYKRNICQEVILEHCHDCPGIYRT